MGDGIFFSDNHKVDLILDNRDSQIFIDIQSGYRFTIMFEIDITSHTDGFCFILLLGKKWQSECSHSMTFSMFFFSTAELQFINLQIDVYTSKISLDANRKVVGKAVVVDSVNLIDKVIGMRLQILALNGHNLLIFFNSFLIVLHF